MADHKPILLEGDPARAEAAWAAVAPHISATFARVRESLKGAGQCVATLSRSELRARAAFGKPSRDLMPTLRPESDAMAQACRVLAAELERLAILLEGSSPS